MPQGSTNYTPYFSLNDSTKIQAAVSSFNSLMGGTISTPPFPAIIP